MSSRIEGCLWSGCNKSEDDGLCVVCMNNMNKIKVTIDCGETVMTNEICEMLFENSPTGKDSSHKKELDASDVLLSMVETFKKRNAVYKNNYTKVPELMKVLFPGGVPSELVVTKQFHLFELVLVKITRFVASGNLDHIDSIHDAAVHCAMIEAILMNESGEINE